MVREVRCNKRQRGPWFVVVLCSLMAGCGSPASDKPVSLELHTGSGESEVRTGAATPGIGQARHADLGAGGEQSDQRGVAANQPVITTGQAAKRNPLPSPTIPEAIVKDLTSFDARDRYHALDYWDSKDKKAPLDPVFTAMEDEDPAVRAKATAIVEQYWAADREKS